jgi:hypothetical protein
MNTPISAMTRRPIQTFLGARRNEPSFLMVRREKPLLSTARIFSFVALGFCSPEALTAPSLRRTRPSATLRCSCPLPCAVEVPSSLGQTRCRGRCRSSWRCRHYKPAQMPRSVIVLPRRCRHYFLRFLPLEYLWGWRAGGHGLRRRQSPRLILFHCRRQSSGKSTSPPSSSTSPPEVRVPSSSVSIWCPISTRLQLELSDSGCRSLSPSGVRSRLARRRCSPVGASAPLPAPADPVLFSTSLLRPVSVRRWLAIGPMPACSRARVCGR